MDKFSIGDSVVASTNPEWGKEIMEVSFITGTGRSTVFHCVHPTWGRGGFYAQDLRKVKSMKINGGRVREGDTVFASRNRAWGTEPLTVVEVRDTSLLCLHPTLGRGVFGAKEVEVPSTARELQIANFKFVEGLLRKMTQEIFGHE